MSRSMTKRLGRLAASTPLEQMSLNNNNNKISSKVIVNDILLLFGISELPPCC